MESSSEPGKVHISEKTKDYLEGVGQLTSRGEIKLKGFFWNHSIHKRCSRKDQIGADFLVPLQSL